MFTVAALILIHRSELEEGTVGSVGFEAEAPQGRVAPPGSSRPRRAFVATAGAGILLVHAHPAAQRRADVRPAVPAGWRVWRHPERGRHRESGVRAAARSAPGPAETAFYGFNDTLDLRVRGELNDNLVMRIRSSGPAMWRGVVFDDYDGVSWKAASADEFTALGSSPPYGYPPQLRSLGPRATDLADLLHRDRAAQRHLLRRPTGHRLVRRPGQHRPPRWTPHGVDPDAGNRVQRRLVARCREPRGDASSGAPVNIPEHVQQFMAVPDSLPERVSDLAREITAGATNDYDKVKAIETWLFENYRVLDRLAGAAGRVRMPSITSSSRPMSASASSSLRRPR